MKHPRALISGPNPNVRVRYNCGCRRPFLSGIWSNRCRLCAGLRMRKHLYREGWARCSTCKTVTRGMIDSHRCRRCQPLLNRPREVR